MLLPGLYKSNPYLILALSVGTSATLWVGCWVGSPDGGPTLDLALIPQNHPIGAFCGGLLGLTQPNGHPNDSFHRILTTSQPILARAEDKDDVVMRL